jgi:uncharacterized damage-inducible protein DinB
MMIDELINTFDSTLKFIEQSVSDLTEQEMVQQPTGVPNHGAWTLGHIIYSCQGIADGLGVEGWLPDDWESLFGYGSTPASEVSHYPEKAEMLTMLTDSADRLRQALHATDESILRQPLPDEQGRKILPTVGHALVQVVAAHTAYHAGQLAIWRRAMGKGSLAVFV